jgi:uncharacterized membrane protein YiaA
VIDASARDFFLGSASIAGALIGLLFVAVSVAPERILGPNASEIHTVRAAAALTAFTNALTVSLFGLVPSLNVGGAATAVAIIGLLFVIGALVRVIPVWRSKRIRLSDVSYLAGLLVVFVIQLLAGLGLDRHARNAGDLKTICILVIVCFLLGIARAWELVGGTSITLSSSLIARLGNRQTPEPPAEPAERDEP